MVGGIKGITGYRINLIEGSSTDKGLVFSGNISNAPFAHVLKLWRHVTLQSPNSREKSESRRYFDYCGIISTEYK